MISIRREPKNPILSPNPDQEFESYASFNGCLVKDKERYSLVYRAMSKPKQHLGHEMSLSTIALAESEDGVNFSGRRLFLKPEFDWEKFGLEDPRVVKAEDEFFIFYTALSSFPPAPQGIKIGLAISKDLETVAEKHLVTPFNSKAMSLFPKKINGQYAAVLTVNTDLPPAKIAYVEFEKKEQIWDKEFWQNWYGNLDQHVIPLQRMNNDQVEVGAPPVETPYGWLLIFSYIKDYTLPDRLLGVEAVLLDIDKPKKIVGRIEKPLLIPQETYEISGNVPQVVFPSGAVVDRDKLSIYYGATDTSVCLATADFEEVLSNMKVNAPILPKLKKYEKNPILEPDSKHFWESKAVFNPAAFYQDEEVYLVYRGMSEDNTSTMGLAIAKNGFDINERLREPIYFPRCDFEDKKKPMANSGCEDPRITKIEDKLYMFYTAYNGVDLPRVALTSISVEDFINKRWNWRVPRLISPPGIDDKDACLLPEKINDQYVIFHRIEGDIVLDFVYDLDFQSSKWLRSEAYITTIEGRWDSRKIGIGPPPLKTDEGWLLTYHGISQKDSQYRVGAMLLKKSDPSKVLSRSDFPILEPEAEFEREGITPNVVFPCGAVVISNDLYVYYGGADRVTCVATYKLNKLISYLQESRTPKYLKG